MNKKIIHNNTKNNKINKRKINRFGALRAQQRVVDDAEKIVDQYKSAPQITQNNTPDTQVQSQLKITFLGGLYDVGEKNMAILEYQNEAIILDCGIDLSVDLPGINYAINDMAYVESIKHKIKAYVITHGHLDHIGGLKHTVPKYPAPIYGSRYTIGIIDKTFQDETLDLDGFKPELIISDMETHERLKIGQFFVEFIRVTHAIPDASAVCIDTPVGRVIATGDFRLDPEPLDNKPSDKTRLKQLGDEGVMLLMSDSSYADSEGRTPTESTLQPSITDAIVKATGRVFVAAFSSNMNRTQMIINAAVASGRKVALDGRGMLSYSEVAVRQGLLKVPKGTIIPMAQAATMSPTKVLVMCTGGQGEPNAALQRMSEGSHKFINLNSNDTVLISSSPIPGNEISYDAISNRLSSMGVKLYRHVTHELDGCGPLHVSGHARRDELREMIQLVRPTYFIPVHAGALRRHYHAELGIEEGVKRANVAEPAKGQAVYMNSQSMSKPVPVDHGTLLVNQAGEIVEDVVLKDVLLLQNGFMNIMLSIDSSGQLTTSPSIASRGVVPLDASTDLLHLLRTELSRAVKQRYGRIPIQRFKKELNDFVVQFIYEHTRKSPVVIIDITTNSCKKTIIATPNFKESKLDQKELNHQQRQDKFQAMRKQLLKSW